MHDPMTVAFQIKYPWWKYRPGTPLSKDGYRESFITIWHIDPEVGGSDDSCGWTYRTARNDTDRKVIRNLASDLSINRESLGTGLMASWLLIERAGFWAGKSPTLRHFKRYLHQQSFPGSWNDYNWIAKEETKRTGWIAWHIYAQLLRPWYRHPRWHLHHWRFQIHPWQKVRRWIFSRCEVCGDRFDYGESPISSTWDSQKPKWFRSEVGSRHSTCTAPQRPHGGAE